MFDGQKRTSGTTILVLMLPLLFVMVAGLPAQVPIRGSVRPQVHGARDLGLIDQETHLSALRISINPSGEQQLALLKMVADQRNPASPSYQQWLTPEKFGALYGISAANEAVVRRWLAAQGFANVSLAKSRSAFYFSGTVAQAQSAFHTEIRALMVGGERHFANVSEVTVPDNLSPLVRNVRGLDDFKLESHAHRIQPRFSGPLGGSTIEGMAPGDIATIYDINSLYAAGFDGTGMKVAVVGQSDIDLNDVAEYRSGYGLPASTPTVITYLGDPGEVPGNEEEGELDVEIVGAVVPKAQISFIVSPDVMNALFYAIEQDVAPVVSMSFGYCESGDTLSNQQDIQFAAEQANAEGMTLLAASGDFGAADCEWQSLPEGGAVNGYAIDSPANQPGFTSVGGTSFIIGDGKYFSGTNGPTGGSAITYIPEKAWNDTQPTDLLATGGGASVFYAKPGWQDSPGVPDDGARDVPDVAMFSMNAQSDGTEMAYLTCTDAMCASGINSADQWGGTSAAAPVFAGIVTLLNEYLVSNNAIPRPGLGNINPQLYLLAQNAVTSFHDITQGNNNVPCVMGSTDCTTRTIGFSAGPGYDQTTGLGSADADNLVKNWTSVATMPTSVALSSSPATVINNNSRVTLTAQVNNSGGGVPTGSVTFYLIAGAIPLGMTNTCLSVLGTAPVDSAGIATLSLPTGLGYNALKVYAAYSGTSAYAQSFSNSVSAHDPGPQVSVSSSTTQAKLGGVVTLTALVYEFTGQPGTITFFNGSTSLGTVSLTPVTAQDFQWTGSISTTSLPSGQNSIAAYYSGDLFLGPSISPAVAVTVSTQSAIDTTTSLTAPSDGGTSGNSVTLTASVTPASGSTVPAGTVTFLNGATTIGTANLNAGMAALTLSSLPVGQSSITAIYAGNNSFSGSTSPPVSVTMTAIGTTTSVIASPSAAVFGSLIALSATVTPASGSTVPAGTVTFLSGATTIGTANLNAGVAALTVSSLPVGQSSITAIYAGSSSFSGSTSPPVSVTMTAIGTTTSVIASPSAAVFGSLIALSATVTPASGSMAPTGTVIFSDGTTAIGTAPLVNGVASVQTSTLAMGQNSITAQYTGIADYSPSSSSPAMLTVAVIGTTTSLIATPSQAVTGSSITITVRVTQLSGSVVPSGVVAFYSGATAIGTAALNGGAASLVISTLPAGMDSLTAAYQGSSDFGASNSPAESVAISAPANAAPSVFSISPAFTSAGAGAFTLTVSGAGFSSGSIVYWGSTALATSYMSSAQLMALVPASSAATAGAVAITVETPAPGGGASDVVQFEVDTDSAAGSAPTFTTAAATVTPGNAAIYPVALPSAASVVSATCLNLPAGASCSYSAATNTTTIDTGTDSPPGTYQITVVFTETMAGTSSAFTLLPLLLLPLYARRRRLSRSGMWPLKCLVILVGTAALTVTGCGGQSIKTATAVQSLRQVTTSAIATLTIQ